MRVEIYEAEVNEYVYDANENGNKIEETKRLNNSDVFSTIHIFAEDGKVFRRISTNEILTNHIGIGSEDTIFDYEEIFA